MISGIGIPNSHRRIGIVLSFLFSRVAFDMVGLKAQGSAAPGSIAEAAAFGRGQRRRESADE